MSTKTVRLDKEVIDALAENREGFETPNDCLKRLLNGKRSCAVEKKETTIEEEGEVES
jgi:hypothetical protein